MQQQPFLAPQPAAIADHLAVAADDAVAGHDDRDRVASRRRADGAQPARVLDRARQLGVRDGLTVGDRGDRLPDALLEGGPLEGQGQVKGLSPPPKVGAELSQRVADVPVAGDAVLPPGDKVERRDRLARGADLDQADRRVILSQVGLDDLGWARAVCGIGLGYHSHVPFATRMGTYLHYRLGF